MYKRLQDSIRTQQSLIQLKRELEHRAGEQIDVDTILRKINSCLYSVYPNFNKEDK